MGKLTYQDLELPFYRNNSIAIRLSAVKFGRKKIEVKVQTQDVFKIQVLTGLNGLSVSDVGGFWKTKH